MNLSISSAWIRRLLPLLLASGVSSVVALASVGQASTPALAASARFMVASVPAIAPTEVPTAPKWPIPADPKDARGLDGHPMLYAGEGYNVLFLVRDGRVGWSYQFGPGGEIDDVWLMSNSHVLCSRQHSIEELTADKQVAWQWRAPAGTEVHTVQPVGTDRVAFVLNGLPPKVIVLNKLTGATELEFSLPAESTTDLKTVHPQTRRMRLTADGTFLVSFLKLGKVAEYNREGREIWSYAAPSPWSAIRLKNGNTLVVLEHDGVVREVNPAKQTVWEWRKTDLPAGITLRNLQTAERLANGDTVLLANTNGMKPEQRPECVQAVEVNPRKQVVWVLQDWRHLGPATTAQFLDQPGIPEQPGDLQR